MSRAIVWRSLLCFMFVLGCEEGKVPESKKDNTGANANPANGNCTSTPPASCSSTAGCQLNSTTGKCENTPGVPTPPACSTLSKDTCNQNTSCKVQNNSCIDPNLATDNCTGKTKKDCTDPSCLWSTADGLCQKNPCKELFGTDSCNANPLCRFDPNDGVCNAKAGVNACQGLAQPQCSLQGPMCSWDGTQCIGLGSSCTGLAQPACTPEISCSWNPTTTLCESAGAICPTLDPLTTCKTNTACLTINNRCVAAVGDCGANPLPAACNSTPGCQWYVTMKACGIATDGGAADRWAEEKKFKSRLTLAAGLGALQGFLGGGGIQGALSKALQSMTTVASTSTTATTGGGLAGALGPSSTAGGSLGGFGGGTGVPTTTGAADGSFTSPPTATATNPSGTYLAPTRRADEGSAALVMPQDKPHCEIIGTEYQCQRLKPRCEWERIEAAKGRCVKGPGY